MADEWNEYVKDVRKLCKYGTKCYQKNPQHHEKFKHPPCDKRKLDVSPQNKHAKVPRNSPRSPARLGQKKEFAIAKAFSDTSPPKNTNKNAISDTKTADSHKTHDKEVKMDNHGKESTSSKDKVLPNSDSENEKTPIRNSTNENDTNTKNSSLKESPYKNPSPVKEIFAKNLKYHDLSISECKLRMKDFFLVDMPEDFYSFYSFITKESPDDLLKSVDLELIGPFDLLFGKLPIVEDHDLYLSHWRFFYDPPEYQAVIKCKGTSEFHIGYYRDSPDNAPVFLGTTDSSKGCKITPTAGNIFGALYVHLQNEKKKSPFTALNCQRWMNKLKSWATEHNFSLDEYDIRKRNVKVNSKTFHGAGIVVPYNKKTDVGYRPLAENDATIKKIFSDLASATTTKQKDKALSDLQPVITYASIAMDECDFGTGLELGINLFCSGLKVLEKCTLDNLNIAYSLLRRDAFAKIIQVHMKYRRKGPNMMMQTLMK